jgi:hypothetical protein
MKTQHSPGPWYRNVPPATKYVTIYRERNTHVCDVIPSRGVSPEEAEANLTLIAASPKMLEALKRIKIVMDGIVHPSCRHPDDALSEVEAAIAAAEGGAA